MTGQGTPNQLSLTEYTPKLASIFAVVIGCLVFAGWAAEVALFKSIIPGFETVKPNTAFTLILCGISLWVLSTFSNPIIKLIGQIFAAAVSIIGLLTICEYLFGSNLWVDYLIFTEKVIAEDVPFPGRISPAAAVIFFLFGISLLCLNFETKSGFRPSQWLTLSAAFISLLALIGYAYNVQALYKITYVTTLSLTTAITCFLLSLGILFVNANRGLTAILLKDSLGGSLARRLLPAALIIPFIIGWLKLKGEQAGYYETGFGVAIFALSSISIFTFLIWWTARSLDKTDDERKNAEDSTRKLLKDFADVRFALDESSIVSITDQKGIITFVNEKFCRISGYTREELIGQDHQIVNSDYHSKDYIRDIWTKIGKGNVWKGEIRNRAKDGSYFWVYTTIVPFLDEQGTPYQYIAIHNDITERKAAETALQQKVLLIEQSYEPIFVWDLEKGIIEWNTGCEQLYGFTREEAVEQPSQSLLRTILPLSLSDFYSELKNNNSWSGEVINYTKDGRRVRVESRHQLLELEGRKVVLETNRDITRQKLAEEALKNSEHRFRALIENSSDGIALIDKNNEILYLSPSVKSIEGYTAEELVGRNGLENTHPDDFPLVQEIVEKLIANPGKPVPVEWRRRHKDGHWIWLEGFATNLLEDSAVEAIVTNYRDVTERKRTEAELRKEKERLEKMAAASPIAIFSFRKTTDGKVNLPYSSPKIYDVFGLTPEELKKDATPAFERVNPEDVIKVYELIDESARTKSVLHVTYRYQNPHKGEIWVECFGTPTVDADGSVTWHGIANDVTERRNSEQLILQLNDTLEHRVVERTSELNAVNKELEAFSYSVSHDLRAPLRAIDGFSLALLEDYEEILDTEGRYFLQRIRAGSQQMARLIDDMLKLSQVTRGEIVKETVNLSEIVKGIAKKLQEIHPRKNVTFDIRENIYANGDERLLRIALENLIDNAYKFTSKREYAEIIFGKKQNENETVYFVCDNGAGFDMTYADKLFGAFQRFHSAKDFEGTGIGLATVQRVINRHGGYIRAESKVGEGTSFYFTIR